MRALAFARALVARWHRRVSSPRPLGLVYRATPDPVQVVDRRRATVHSLLRAQLRSDVHVELRPHIALTLVRPLEQTTSSAAGELVRVERLVLRNTSALAAARVVERVSSRSTRVELVVRTPPPAAGPSSRGEPEAPPALVVQRSAVAPAAVREPPAEAAWPAAPLLRGAERAVDAVPGAPQLDLSRLTDQVMATIDRRLLSHAERLGRG